MPPSLVVVQTCCLFTRAVLNLRQVALVPPRLSPLTRRTTGQSLPSNAVSIVLGLISRTPTPEASLVVWLTATTPPAVSMSLGLPPMVPVT
ncbi:hypothetical protein BKA81DRAFT_356340 [Phyllosticta paracitricarpa]